MKKSTCVLFCVGSASLSSLLTYIFTKRHFQKKLEKICENCQTPTVVHDSITVNAAIDKDFEQAIREQLNKYGTNTIDVNLEEEDTPTEEEMKEDDLSLDPYVCTDEEFMNSEEKAYFTVYKDGVIADDKDKVIRNAAHYLGEDILKTLSSQGDDPLYVRNPVLNIAIEIGFSLEDYEA